MKPILLLTALLLICSCRKKKEEPSIQTDTVTAASLSTQDWLPEPGETYETIGYVEGVKGAIIRYSDDLYRGGDILSDAGILLLKKRGVKSIISATPNETIRSLSKAYSLEQYDFPFDYQGLTEESVKEFYALMDIVERPVYIHCHGGKQRAGNLCMLYRGYVEKWDFDKAMKEYIQLGGKETEDREMMQMAFTLLP